MPEDIEQITDHARRAILALNPVFWGKPRIASFVWALTSEVQDLEDAIYSVISLRMVDNAFDIQLAVLGRIVGQPNVGGFDTELYRALIRCKIRTNRSRGTLRDILETIALLLSEPAEWYQAGWATLALIVAPVSASVLAALTIVLRNAKQAEEGLLLYVEPSPVAAPPAPDPPTIVGTTTAISSSSVSWAAGHQTGDVGLLFAVSLGENPEPSAPAGFTRLAGAGVGVSASGEARITVFYRVATSGSESAVSVSGSTKGLVVVRNWLSIADAVAQASADADQAVAIAPASSAAQSRALVFAGFAIGNSASSIVPPLTGTGASELASIANVTEGFSPGLHLSLYAGTLDADAFGPISASLSVSKRWAAATITLAPWPQLPEQVGLRADSAASIVAATAGWGSVINSSAGGLAFHVRQVSNLGA